MSSMPAYTSQSSCEPTEKSQHVRTPQCLQEGQGAYGWGPILTETPLNTCRLLRRLELPGGKREGLARAWWSPFQVCSFCYTWSRPPLAPNGASWNFWASFVQ